MEHVLHDGRVVTLREAEVGDAEAIVAYCEEVAGESDNLSFGAGEFGISVERERIFLGSVLATANQVYFLAEHDGQIVGSLSCHGPQRVRMVHAVSFGMTVRAGWWGLGIGAALMDAMLAWAPGAGVTKINLSVRTDNAAAIRLYERKGFVHEGTETRCMRIDGVYVDCHRMGLEL